MKAVSGYILSTLRSLVFCQLIKEPTRVTAQSATLMGMIAMNNEKLISKSGVFNATLSDHDLNSKKRTTCSGLMKIALNNVLLPTLFKVVNNTEQVDEPELACNQV